MTAIQLAGVLLITGSLIFWLGAALPTWRVYVTTAPDVRAQLITDNRSYWVLSHVCFLAGVVTVAIGLGVFTSTIETSNARSLAIIGLVAITLASAVWAYIVLAFRLTMPVEEYVRTTAGAWTFPAYTLLTLGAFILYGVVLLSTDYAAWVGITTIGLSSLILVAFIIQKDAIPGMFYIVTLIMGIALLP